MVFLCILYISWKKDSCLSAIPKPKLALKISTVFFWEEAFRSPIHCFDLCKQSFVSPLILFHSFGMRLSSDCLLLSCHGFIISSTLARPFESVQFLFVIFESSLVDLVIHELIALIDFGYVVQVLQLFLVPLSYNGIALTECSFFIFASFFCHLAAILLVVEGSLSSVCLPSVTMQSACFVFGSAATTIGLLWQNTISAII